MRDDTAKLEKAHRLLTEGCLNVLQVKPSDGRIVAEVQGDTGVYMLGYDPGDHVWRCSCDANSNFHVRCSHLIALQLISGRPQGAPAYVWETPGDE